jgi:hypothetical protein
MRFHFMKRMVSTICIAAAALFGGAAAAFEPTSGVLTEHQKILQDRDQQPAAPFAMNYTDEAAQTLGVHDGRWEAIDLGPSRSGLVPKVSGAIERGNPMIQLQWRVGQ